MSGSRRLRIAAMTAGGLAAALTLTTAATAAAASTPWRTAPAGPAATVAPTGIAAAGGELYDVTAGKMLWGHRHTTVRAIASITKVMTAYVAISAGTLSRKITITAAEAGFDGPGVSKAGLHAGEVLTTQQLLYAMLLPSGADAADALAVTYGPGTPAFVAKMNKAAKALGMTKTTYGDSVGLYGDMSSPQDLLTLGQAAMKLPAFAAVVGQKTYSMKSGSGHRAHYWTNLNLLLGSYKYADGIKTGWTPAAGQCLLFMASYNGHVLIGVVLDSAPGSSLLTAFSDATKLLNWAYVLKIAAPALAFHSLKLD